MLILRAPLRAPLGLKARCAFQEIVARIAIEQRTHAWTSALEIRVADHDQAFLFVGDIKEAIDKVDRLFFIFRAMGAQGIDAQSCGSCHRHRVLRRNIESADPTVTPAR